MENLKRLQRLGGLIPALWLPLVFMPILLGTQPPQALFAEHTAESVRVLKENSDTRAHFLYLAIIGLCVVSIAYSFGIDYLIRRKSKAGS